MRRTEHAEAAFVEWGGVDPRAAEAFAMGYVMGQGDALQGLDQVAEGCASVADVREAITVLVKRIADEAAIAMAPPT